MKATSKCLLLLARDNRFVCYGGNLSITDIGTKMLKCCYNKNLKHVTLASKPSAEETAAGGSKNVVAKIFGGTNWEKTFLMRVLCKKVLR